MTIEQALHIEVVFFLARLLQIIVNR